MKAMTLALALALASTPALADGIVRSKKTGAVAHVSARFVARFQAYIDDLESLGATVRFMGGYRRGRCGPAHEHPCGKALDVCQTRRDRVDPRCHLPGRRVMFEVAARHGLFEGGAWCHGDLGHAQIGVTAAPCHRSASSLASIRSRRLSSRAN